MSAPRTADGIAAALLFARGRAEGLLLLPPTEAAAWHSFRAALFCLPAFLGLRLLAWSQQGAPRGGLLLALLAELVGFVLSWAGFALASRVLAEQAQRLSRWPHFLAAWNWSNLVLHLLLVASAVPVLLGAPPWLSNALGLVLLGYAMWLEWFVAREALGVAGATAVMFVLLDVAIGLFVGGLSARIAGGG